MFTLKGTVHPNIVPPWLVIAFDPVHVRVSIQMLSNKIKFETIYQPKMFLIIKLGLAVRHQGYNLNPRRKIRFQICINILFCWTEKYQFWDIVDYYSRKHYCIFLFCWRKTNSSGAPLTIILNVPTMIVKDVPELKSAKIVPNIFLSVQPNEEICTDSEQLEGE